MYGKNPIKNSVMELTKDTNETGQTEMTQMPDALSAQQLFENIYSDRKSVV